VSSGRSLVTGGSGYFGHLLVKKLLQKGEGVRVFDLSDSTDRPRDVKLCQGDIRNFDDIRRACQGIDRVYHNVAQVPLARDKKLFWSVNRDGTENLLKACAEAGVKKVVYTSSRSALAQKYGFKFGFFWQPIISIGKKPLTDEEQAVRSSMDPAIVALYASVYRIIEQSASQYENLYYMGHIFDEYKSGIWIDDVHITPAGNQIIAQKMLSVVATRNHAQPKV
jgi:dTDP-4-dehydrorhamnose reductase